MKRKIASLLMLAMTLPMLLLTGCGTPDGNPLPEGMEEQAVLDTGRQVVEQLNGGDYQAVYDQLRADAQETTSPAKIQEYMEERLEKVGAYERETQAMATGQKIKDTGEEYGTAVFFCKHKKKDVMYRIAFSIDMELIGFEANKK